MDMNAAYIVPGGRPPPGGAGNDRAMGAILVDAGRLTPEDAEIILRNQRDEGLRFGDAALRLGLLSEEDIQFALSRQFDYPYLAPGDLSVSKELVAAFSPFTPLVEQLRALRSQLMLRWFDGEPGSSSARRILPILSPGHGEGRSFIAANLAVVFSQLGERTLLIDADLRSPHQADIFHLENRPDAPGWRMRWCASAPWWICPCCRPGRFRPIPRNCSPGPSSTPCSTTWPATST